MKFSIYFEAPDYGKAYYKESCEVGLNLIDKARKDLGVPKLPIDVFHKTIDVKYSTGLTVDIPEDLARRSGHFGDCASITVEVPKKWINEFMFIDRLFEKDEYSGEITYVTHYHEIDDEALLAEWAHRGFPIEIKE